MTFSKYISTAKLAAKRIPIASAKAGSAGSDATQRAAVARTSPLSSRAIIPIPQTSPIARAASKLILKHPDGGGDQVTAWEEIGI
ncbi:hypothetical protein SESBI_33236 [Sesbania bispinosa]|nr:hypothetical protein SESBI_33236 [Sesbania bispinosa]